ncbi:MAG: DUF7453 family protein, partial [Terriglobales bacterium]
TLTPTAAGNYVLPPSYTLAASVGSDQSSASLPSNNTILTVPAQYPAFQPIVTDQTALALPNTMDVPFQSVIDQAGDYAFIPSGQNAVFYRKAGDAKPTRLLQMGDAFPGTAGSRIDLINAVRMNNSGQLALNVSYNLATTQGTNALMIYSGGTLRTLLTAKDTAPNTGGKVYGRGLSIIGLDDAGNMAFSAPLYTGADLLTAVNQLTLFIAPASGPAVRVAGVGDVAPGTAGGTFGSLTFISMNTAGAVLIRAGISGGVGGQAFYLGTTSGLQKVAAVGDSTTNAGTLTAVNSVQALNNNGEVVFSANNSSGLALWSWTSAAGIARVMGVGDAAPSDVGGTISGFGGNLALSDSGGFVAQWTLTGSGTVANGQPVLIRYNTVQGLSTIAYGGEIAEGTANTFSSFSAVSINAVGAIGFRGQPGTGIYVNGGGLNGLSSFALDGQYAVQANGVLFSPVARTPFVRVLDNNNVFANVAIYGGTSDYAEFVAGNNIATILMSDADTIPSGAQIQFRSTFSASSSGQYVAYMGSYTGGRIAYFLHDLGAGTDTKIVGAGDAVPGVSGALFNLSVTNQLMMNAGGQVVFSAAYVTATGSANGIFFYDPSTGLHKIAGIGDTEPSTGSTFTGLSLSTYGHSVINDSGQFVFGAALANGKSGLFVYNSSGEIGKVVLSGDAASDGGTFQVTSLLQNGKYAINNAGQVAFAAITNPSSVNTAGIFIGTPGGSPFKVGTTGTNTTATTGFSFNNAGEVAYIANGSLYTGSATSTATVYATTGGGTPAGGTFMFPGSSDVVIDDNHDLLFRSSLMATSADSAIFLRPGANGTLQTVAMQGQAAPGTTRTFTTILTSLNGVPENRGFDPAGNVMFGANATDGTLPIFGTWRYRPSGNVLEKIVTRGDGAPVSGGGELLVYIAQNLAGTNTPSYPAFFGAVTGGTYHDAIFAVNPVSANLSLTSPAVSVPLGMTSGITFTVTNNGPSVATNTNFTLVLPAGVTAASLPQGCSGTTTITCAVGTVDAGEASSGTFDLTFDASLVPPDGPSAVVSLNGSISADNSNVANATAVVSVERQSDLQLVSATDNSPANLAGPLIYNLTIKNNGANDATGVIATLNLPSNNYIFLSSTFAGGCTQTANQVVCSIGALAAGSSVSGTVSITPDPAAVTGVSAVVVTGIQLSSATVVDPVPTNNGFSVNTTLAHTADLSMTGAGPAASVTAGSPVTFTATVTTNGPEAAIATVVATLPPGFTFVSANYTNQYAGNGSCTFASNLITCPVGSLPYAPASATITVNATAGSQLGFFSLGATASSSTTLDPVPLSDSASATALVALTTNAKDSIVFSVGSHGSYEIDDLTLRQVTAQPAPFIGLPFFGPLMLPNGRTGFLTASNKYLSVIDVTAGSEIARVPVSVQRMPALSPDAKTLVTVFRDTVSLIDTASFQVTTINLDGTVGDDPSLQNDIN